MSNLDRCQRVDRPFAVEAAVLNAGLVYSSYKFYSQQT